MNGFDNLLAAAEQMISDFPADWSAWCYKNKVVHPDVMDEFDFYQEMMRGDK